MASYFGFSGPQMAASDLSAVAVSKIEVGLPAKASLFPIAVWTYRMESFGLASDGRATPVSRTLEDVAWLRRALVYAVPGVVVPPGPLAGFAASSDGTAEGDAPLNNEEARWLKATGQVFVDRVLAHVELRCEPLFKSFCFDAPEQWEARKAEAEEALKVAPATVRVGSAWDMTKASLGLGVQLDAGDKAEKAACDAHQAWVIAADAAVERCERAARDFAAAAVDRARMADALLACGADVANLSPARVLAARCASKRDARAPTVAAHRRLADLRALLGAAQEAANMRELCRHEALSARRQLADHRRSNASRKAQLDQAALREIEAESSAGSLAAYGLSAASSLARAHADAALSNDKDVLAAEKLDGILRCRSDVAGARFDAQLAWLRASWPARTGEALHDLCAAEAHEKKTLADQFADVADHAKAVSDAGFPAYAPPDFAAAIASDPDPAGAPAPPPDTAATPPPPPPPHPKEEGEVEV